MGSGTCTSYHTLNLTGPSYIWSENYCFDDEITKVSRTGHRRHRTAVLLPFTLKRILRLHSVFSKGGAPPKKNPYLQGYSNTAMADWATKKLTLVTA